MTIHPAPNDPSAPTAPGPTAPGNKTFHIVIPITKPAALPRIHTMRPDTFHAALGNRTIIRTKIFRRRRQTRRLHRALVTTQLSTRIISNGTTLPDPTPAPAPPDGATPNGDRFQMIMPVDGNSALRRIQAIRPRTFHADMRNQSVIRINLFRRQRQTRRICRALVTTDLPTRVLDTPPPTISALPPVPGVPHRHAIIIVSPNRNNHSPNTINVNNVRRGRVGVAVSGQIRRRLRSTNMAILVAHANSR